MTCPICENVSTEAFIIKSAKLAKSNLYKDIIIRECSVCTHQFNSLTDQEKKDLDKYYKDEYAVSRDKVEDKAVKSFKTPFRASQELLNDYIQSLRDINTKNNIQVEGVNAVFWDQFLEHCWNMPNVIATLKKIETADMFLSVPDLSRYYEISNLPYFYLIKEHIQHFNRKSISMFLEKCGFKCMVIRETELSLLNGHVLMPNLELWAYKSKADSGLIYIYGASREVMYLIENNPALQATSIIFDETPFKAGSTISGIPVTDPKNLNQLPENSKMVIASLGHAETIREKIKNAGYKGKIIDFI
jgi:hypothetical protein